MLKRLILSLLLLVPLFVIGQNDDAKKKVVFDWWLSSSQGVPIQEQYTTYLAKLTTDGVTLPPADVQTLQNLFVYRIQSIWSKLDIIRLVATNYNTTAIAARYNIKNPSANLATITGGVTYSYGGWKANGTDGEVNNNFTPSTAGGNYSLNSAFEGVYISKVSSSSKTILTGHASGTGSFMTNQSSVSQRLNSGGDLPTAADLSGFGFKCLNRASSAGMETYADLDQSAKTIASFNMPTGSRLLFRQGSSYGDGEIGAYFLGGSLTQAEQAILRNAVNEYITGIYLLNYADPTPLNVYLLWGQSNAAGRGSNASIAAPLNGAVGTKVFFPQPAPYTAITSTSFAELTLGTNNTTENLGTQHGSEMRMGYDLYQVHQNCAIIKYAVGGTAISQWAPGPSGLFSVMVDNITLKCSLYELRHTIRRPIVIRGAAWIQGESDCVSGLGASYQTKYDALILATIKQLNNAGYKTNKLRWVDYGVKNGGSAGYDPTDFANVIAAKQYLMSNFATDHPTFQIAGLQYYSPDAIPLGDTQHYTAAGLDTMGAQLASYFAQYVNE